jgi:hypothetical protein
MMLALAVLGASGGPESQSSSIPGSGSWYPIPPCNQGKSEGNAADSR